MFPFLRALSAAAIATLVTLTPSAVAQINVGSDGSDGALNIPNNQQWTDIDLNLAPVGNWDDPSLEPGKGIYDPNLWAVVFKYESVNIPPQGYVRFINRAHGNPPVIWLVRTNATISGFISIGGFDGASQAFSRPGPGGFSGGIGDFNGNLASVGFGPGGGTAIPNVNNNNRGLSNASFGTLAGDSGGWSPPMLPYSNPTLMPLIGGSGGSSYFSAGNGANSGGAGGGAIMIAVGGTCSIPGIINANGGYQYGIGGGGSGGGVRIVANQIAGVVRINAVGGQGYNNTLAGQGRIRIEANDLSTAVLTVNPPASIGPVSPLFPNSSTPKVQIASVEGLAAPADPRSDINVADIALTPIGEVDIDINAFNIPATWVVQVQVKPRNGTDIYFNASRISGNDSASLYRASIPQFPIGLVSLQVRAYLP